MSMMHKIVCTRAFSEICRNNVSTPSPNFLSLVRRQVVRFVQTDTKSTTDTNDITTKLEDRQLPPKDSLQKYLPFKFVQKRIEELRLGKALQFLYEDLCDEVHYLEFFHDFYMEDVFSSWFTVMELHIYILCCRFMKEGPKVGLPIRDSLTDIFWGDVQLRAERLGEIASSIRIKQLRILSNQFQAAFYGYDEGVQSDDRILAATIWRRFFAYQCHDASQIERLVKYIRLQLDVLHKESLDNIIYKKRRLFIPLPEVTI